MRRAATSANALTLPPPLASPRPVSVAVVRGRQQVIRSSGIFISVVGRWRRMVYLQLDGEIELADACKCATDWQPDFVVTRSLSCPIDQHRMRALQEVTD
jgi:hypothetical protein